MVLILELVLLVALFGLSAFFSSSESALFSLDPMQVHRIREEHPHAGERIERALSKPTRLLSTILIGNTLVNVVASALGFALLEQMLPAQGILIAIPCMTVLLLVFGEISPKRLALRFPEKLSILYAMPLDVLTRILTPATRALGWVAQLLKRWLIPSPKLTEDEFRTALLDGEKEGVLDSEERSIVEGIIRLEGLTTGDVMTPRVDLVAADEEISIEEISRLARKARFKFLPIYKGTPDHVQGFLDVRHFLLSSSPALQDALIPPIFVSQSMPLNKLMVLLENRRQRAACVVDEFGGTAGIVTLGDVMDEIIDEEPLDSRVNRVGVEAIGLDRWQIGGDTSLEEINDELDLELRAEEGASRIGGWVSERLERIPRRGDIIRLPECRITVRAVRNRRVTSIVFERRSEEEEA
jgi:putative hemolysin